MVRTVLAILAILTIFLWFFFFSNLFFFYYVFAICSDFSDSGCFYPGDDPGDILNNFWKQRICSSYFEKSCKFEQSSEASSASEPRRHPQVRRGFEHDLKFTSEMWLKWSLTSRGFSLSLSLCDLTRCPMMLCQTDGSGSGRVCRNLLVHKSNPSVETVCAEGCSRLRPLFPVGGVYCSRGGISRLCPSSQWEGFIVQGRGLSLFFGALRVYWKHWGRKKSYFLWTSDSVV